VKKLEAEVGMQLLERVGKDQMRPTAAGAHLLAFVGPFLRDLPAVVRACAPASSTACCRSRPSRC
jgi:DNA-binding transcriptional LysR family regulator